jgi:hypothetical protein
MLGSKNRDYKTSDRSVRRQLAVHRDRTNELVTAGLSRADASTQAYGELKSGYLNDRLEAWADPVLSTHGSTHGRPATD